MILSDRQIEEAVENRRIVVEPFEREQVQPASYDLRVGGQGATTGSSNAVLPWCTTKPTARARFAEQLPHDDAGIAHGQR